ALRRRDPPLGHRERRRDGAFPAGDEPGPAGDERLSEELPSARRGAARLPLRRRGPPPRPALSRGFGHGADDGARRLLSDLSDGGGARPAAERRALRHPFLVLPPRALGGCAAAAELPHA